MRMRRTYRWPGIKLNVSSNGEGDVTRSSGFVRDLINCESVSNISSS
jgi:hypothetical protein